MDETKSIFASKTFWVNVLAVVAMFVPDFPVQPDTMVEIMGAGNILLRMLTDRGVHLIGS